MATFLRRHDFICPVQCSLSIQQLYKLLSHITCQLVLLTTNVKCFSRRSISCVYQHRKLWCCFFFPVLPGTITILRALPLMRHLLSVCYCFENMMTKHIITIIKVQDFFLFYFKSISSSLFKIQITKQLTRLALFIDN